MGQGISAPSPAFPTKTIVHVSGKEKQVPGRLPYWYTLSSDISIAGNDSTEVYPQVQHDTLFMRITYLIDNSKIRGLATNDTNQADTWVDSVVLSPLEHPNITCSHIVVGDMSSLRNDPSRYLEVDHAIKNIYKAIERNRKKYVGEVIVTTMVGVENFVDTTPWSTLTKPSMCRFPESEGLEGILKFLKAKGFPLILKLYPRDVYENHNPNKVDVAHFVFDEEAGPYITDYDQTSYNYVLDAMVDSFDAAMRALKLTYGDNKIAVATGWLEKDYPADEINEGRYISRLIHRHITAGTPKHPDFLDTFIIHEDKVQIKHAGNLVTKLSGPYTGE